jgi:hypothetical protein
MPIITVQFIKDVVANEEQKRELMEAHRHVFGRRGRRPYVSHHPGDAAIRSIAASRCPTRLPDHPDTAVSMRANGPANAIANAQVGPVRASKVSDRGQVEGMN